MKKENFKQLCHLLAGFAIISRAYQSFEQKEYGELVLYAITGAIILVVAGIEEWLVKKAASIEWIFFFLESAVLLYIAFFDESKKYYKFLFAGSGVVYTLLGVYFCNLSLKKKKTSHRRTKKHSRRRGHTGYKYQKEVEDGE